MVSVIGSISSGKNRIGVLLCGGIKKRQSDDIARAKQLVKEIDDDN